MNLLKILNSSNILIIDILAIFTSFVESWLLYKFFLLFFNIPHRKKEKCLFIPLFTIVGTISNILPDVILKDILTICAFLFIVQYIFKQDFKSM